MEQFDRVQGNVGQLSQCSQSYANNCCLLTKEGDFSLSDNVIDYGHQPRSSLNQGSGHWGQRPNQDGYHSGNEYTGQQSYANRYAYEENSIYENPDMCNLRSEPDAASNRLSDGPEEQQGDHNWPNHGDDMDSNSESDNIQREKGGYGGKWNRGGGSTNRKGKGAVQEWN